MVTPVEIANSAIRQLGGRPIVSFDDGTALSNAARDEYPVSRDAVLQAHPWNFACFYAVLAELETPPAWGWAHQYALDTEPYTLRVLNLDKYEPFEIAADREQGRVLMTNATTANVRYIGRVEDVAHWQDLAVQALIKYLAAQLAPFLTRQQTRKTALLEEFQLLLPSAGLRDAKEGTPRVIPANRRLVHSRLGTSVQRPERHGEGI
jgi:hypothetical protein